MPNARDAHAIAKHRIFLVGDTGSGKSTQILTLPGRKFVYCFDGNTLPAIKGHDVDYEEYLPTPVSAAVASLSKSAPKDARGTTSSDVYMQFERTFDERLKDQAWLDLYDWICFDSATTLQDLIMDRVLTINGRFGQWPQEDDWGPQMNAFTNFCRTLQGMDKNILLTGHMQDKRVKRGDQTTRRVPMLTGSMVQKIPLLFSDILGCDMDKDKDGNPVYKLITVPNGEFTVIRTAIKGLNPIEDITIDFSQDPVGQGLGGILNWEAKQSGSPSQQ